MPSPLSRRVAVAAAAAPLAVAGLAVVGAVAAGFPADAATPATCTAGVADAAVHTTHPAQPAVTGSVHLSHKKHRWTASESLSATYWSASVTEKQTICSNDTKDTALTYTDTVTKSAAPVTSGAKAKGPSKKAAKKALAKKVTKAKKRLAARAEATSLATPLVTAARAQAASTLKDESHVFYLVPDVTSGTLNASTAPTKGGTTLSQNGAGDLLWTLPAGYPDSDLTEGLPCLTVPATWPRTWVFDGGTTSNVAHAPGTGSTTFSNPAALQAAMDSGNADADVAAFGVPLVAGDASNVVPLWNADWEGTVDGTSGQVTSVTESATPNVDSSGAAATTTAPALCFSPNATPTDGFPAGTITFHAPRIGSGWSYTAPTTTGGTPTLTLLSPQKITVG